MEAERERTYGRAVMFARVPGRAFVWRAVFNFVSVAAIGCGGEASGDDDDGSAGESGTAGNAGTSGSAGTATGGTGTGGTGTGGTGTGGTGGAGATLSDCFPVDPNLPCELVCQAESAACVAECAPLGTILHDSAFYDGLAACEADMPTLLGVGSCNDTTGAQLFGLTYVRCCCG